MNNTQQRHGRQSSRRFSRSRDTERGTSTGHSRPYNRGNGGTRGGRKGQVFDVSNFINKRTVEKVQPADVVEHTFADFGLNSKLYQTVASHGFAAPTAIQDKIIPHILKGTDVIGLSNTGTGKTAAFLIPLIQKTMRDYEHQTLILAPTRELAIQIQQELRTFTKGIQIYTSICVGGMNIGPQIRSLKMKNHFIIGTPGRVIDLIERKCINQKSISAVVLDEADRMLDMGFINDMRRILSGVPKERHTMLFSATMSLHIQKLVQDFLQKPVTVSVKKEDITSSIEQDVIRIGSKEKFDVLVELLADKTFSRVLVFGAMKHSVEKLSRQLKNSGITAESIHGNKSHAQRQRALQKFKEAHTQVLVATDVAARGIHVDSISHVINYDLPNTYEDYVHRIGRTGRGEHQGKALTFVR